MNINPLLCRNVEYMGVIKFRFQYFAIFILMIQDILFRIKQGKDLTQWQDLYQTKEALGVTISNLVHRLRDLGSISIPDLIPIKFI